MALWNALFRSGQMHHWCEAFPGTRDCTSPAMRKAVQEWFEMYYAETPDDAEQEDPCQRIPFTIVSKLYRACFAEYRASVRSDFFSRCQRELDEECKKAVQLAMIGGESWLKPIPAKDRFIFTVVQRDAVAVLGRDGKGRVTDMISGETTQTQSGTYTLLERRTVDSSGYLTIRNKLYLSRDGSTLGVPAALTALPQYAAIPKEYTFERPLGGIGLVSLRMPIENTVDGSADAVSIYAPAVRLIHNINRNEWQLSREFELGAFRIFASADLLRQKKGGARELPEGLFVGVEDDPQNTGVKEFAPKLRDESFLRRKNEYLRNAESILGIKHGLLCDVADVQRTATEVTSSAGDYSLTVQDLWRVWEKADREALQLCAVLGEMYHMHGGAFDPEKDLSVSWGNGVLYDPDADLAQELEMVAAGLLRPEYPLGKKYGMPTQTQADLAAIRKKYMPPMEQLLEPDTEEE